MDASAQTRTYVHAATNTLMCAHPNSQMQIVPKGSSLFCNLPFQNSQTPHVCWVHKEFISRAEPHLQAIWAVVVESGRVEEKDWTLHPPPPPPFLFYLLPGQDILKEVQGVRSMEDGGVCVCGHVRVCEARAAGSPSSHFMLRGTLLSRSGALKPLKFINMFKLFQGFFTDTPPPHHQLLHLHLHLLLQHNNTPFLMD